MKSAGRLSNVTIITPEVLQEVVKSLPVGNLKQDLTNCLAPITKNVELTLPGGAWAVLTAAATEAPGLLDWKKLLEEAILTYMFGTNQAEGMAKALAVAATAFKLESAKVIE